MTDPVDEFHDGFQGCQVVFVLTWEAVLVTEVLYELDIGPKVFQNLLFFNLQKSIDAWGEEHVGSIGLPIQRGFLEHDRDDPAEIDEHCKLSFGGFVLV